MLLRQPDRRSRSWRAENHFQLPLRAHLKAFIEPLEAKDSGARLHGKPCELGHVNDLKAQFGDAIEIALPLFA